MQVVCYSVVCHVYGGVRETLDDPLLVPRELRAKSCWGEVRGRVSVIERKV